MADQPPPAFHSIHHDGSPRYVISSTGADLCIGDNVALRLRAGWEVPLERVFLRLCPDGEQRFVELTPEDTTAEAGSACRWWRGSIQVEMPSTHYRFLLFTGEGAWWYNGTGLHRLAPTDQQDFRLLAGYQAPQWVRDAVFYQIFPDRFMDGDPGNNVKSGEFSYMGYKSRAAAWGQPPMDKTREALLEFFGGDLLGIEQQLDYLEELGVNALYLNPVFTAYSNHRYDVADYFNVDPHLGGNQALASLRRATASRGIHLILDIVPNHCGVLHPWFQAALKDPSTPTAEFFTFNHHPDDYATWLGVRTLPKLNYRSQALRELMYAGSGSVFRSWLRPPYSIDGWRLDVANMLGRQGADQLGQEVGQGIRKAVKDENPQAYLLGENFFDGTPQLQGDLWDATMNYSGFMLPLFYWLRHFWVHPHVAPHPLADSLPWPTESLAQTWLAYQAAIPWSIARQQFNLLGSHDTQRVLDLLQGNPALNRLAAGVLMTYPGVPCIYYGNETGLGGNMRQCMNWDRGTWDLELHEFYRRLVALRRSSPALIAGGYQVLHCGEDTLVYLRDAEEEQMIVVAQRGEAGLDMLEIPVVNGGIPDGIALEEVFSGQTETVSGGILSLSRIPPGIQVWCTLR
jgi:alpha-glucosidase